MRVKTLFALLVALVLTTGVLLPRTAIAQEAQTLDIASLSLSNGQYAWADGADGYGDIELVISIPMQMLFVYRDGDLIGASTVSTGKRSKPTPTGEFTILQKNVFHRSNIYSNAPMPYMQRLTWTGIAIHAGHLPGYPASHGCIRLPRAFAERLFDITAMGGKVLVTDRRVPDALPVHLREPPPVLVADASDYESERFNMVRRGADAYAAPGETVYAPAAAVVQPVPASHRR